MEQSVNKPKKATRSKTPAKRQQPMSLDVVKPIKSAIQGNTQNVEQLDMSGSSVAAKNYESMIQMTKEQIDASVKAATGAFKNYDGAALFGKDHVEALVAYNSSVAKGFEAMLKGLVAFGQKSFEGSVAATKDMMACRTMKDFTDWQTEVARNNFDTFVAEATKLSELGVKAAQEATQPLSERFHQTVEKFWKQQAA